jgi:hypothetical protein
MTNEISKKQQLDEQRRKRRQAARAWPTAAEAPPRAIPVLSAAPRAPAPLPAHRYPEKRVALGRRQGEWRK